MSAERSHHRIVNLQALRFAAALAVVLYHLAPYYARFGREEAFFAPVAAWGFMGVDVFFVLSGFIIALTTRRVAAPRDVARFALRRLARIYLAWWPVFVAAAGLTAFAAGGRAIDYAGSFLLLPMPLEHSLVPVTWTLSYELAFYAFVALALLAGRRYCLALLLLQGALVLVANAVFIADGLYTPAGLAGAGIVEKFLLSPYWLEFIAGFALAEVMHRWPPRGAMAALAPPAAGVGVLALAAAAGWLPTPDTLFGFFEKPERVAVGLIAATLLVHALAAAERGLRWRLPAVLGRLGDSSYSLYLTHTLTLHWGALGLERLGVPALAGLAPEILLVASLVVGIGTSRLVEWPLYRLAAGRVDTALAGSPGVPVGQRRG